MRYSNAEDYGLLLLLPCALALVLTINNPGFKSRVLALSSPIGVEKHDPDYVITVTAKRLPTDCKTGGRLHGSASCSALIAEAPRVEMRPSKTEVAGGFDVLKTDTDSVELAARREKERRTMKGP